MAGRTYVVLDHPIQTRPSLQHRTIQYNSTHQSQIAVWLALAISRNKSDVNSNRWEMAGIWLGGWPLRFPQIAGVIPDRCTMAGR